MKLYNPYNKDHSKHKIPSMKTISSVLIIFGFINLLTAWIYNSIDSEVINNSIIIENQVGYKEIGPLHTSASNEIYSINIRADLSTQTWADIDTQILDSNKEYLFSFNKELVSYHGTDSEGDWKEKVLYYTNNIILHDTGTYYINFIVSSNSTNIEKIEVSINRKYGNSLPHIWIGILTIILGIIFYEIYNRCSPNI
mgnify:CR=1 FL=1